MAHFLHLILKVCLVTTLPKLDLGVSASELTNQAYSVLDSGGNDFIPDGAGGAWQDGISLVPELAALSLACAVLSIFAM